MKDQRFINLSALKYHKDALKEECDLMPVIKEFSGRNERRVRHFGNVVGENNMLCCTVCFIK